MSVRVEHGDMREVLGRMVAEGQIVQAIVTDPPYHLTSIVKRFGSATAAPAKVGQTGAYARASTGFMGKIWDGGDIAFQSGTWRLCFDLLPPGGHLIAFSGTRTYHRMAVAIEEAGFEIRDMVSWIYGSGFPKSHNVSKGIDKAAGAEREVLAEGEPVKRMIPGADQHKSGWEKNNGRVYVPTETAAATDAARQWEGWGTALKPALEPICLARKPLDGTVAQTVLKHGTGALNIDGCRIESGTEHFRGEIKSRNEGGWAESKGMHTPGRGFVASDNPAGRWPANVCHDGSDEVVRAFPQTKSGTLTPEHTDRGKECAILGKFNGREITQNFGGDTGSAARFFYAAKAGKKDRAGSKHPTVKPVSLMRWLVRLITPPGGTVLDPFAGSGTTGMACMAEGFDAILVEREAEYVADIRRRIAHVTGQDAPLFSAAGGAS